MSIGISRDRSGCTLADTVSSCCLFITIIWNFAATSSISKENSIEVIHLDILRTFPTLSFFQEVIQIMSTQLYMCFI